MTKICFTQLLNCPPGCQGVIKSKRSNWSQLWWVGAIKFSQKLKKQWKTLEIEQKLLKKPCSLKVFLNTIQFRLNLNTSEWSSFWSSGSWQEKLDILRLLKWCELFRSRIVTVVKKIACKLTIIWTLLGVVR